LSAIESGTTRSHSRVGLTAEHQRLEEPFTDPVQPWRKWGPYVCERSWGSVREDYSTDGRAWDYLPHDHARSRAYRWGEDGIAGICDRYQLLVFALGLWNERDPILKERMFGLSGPEGNHGEDVKEYWFYLDNTPTHSYMRMLYKYPQGEFPYGQLVEENRRRWGQSEFELLDTGIFDTKRYFDVFIEYAKAAPEDICIRIEAINRGPESAPLHLIPQLWFRNTWSWTQPRGPEPIIARGPQSAEHISVLADGTNVESPTNLQFRYSLGSYHLYSPMPAELLFTNNETNFSRIYGLANHPRYVKDAFHRQIIGGEPCTHSSTGTKAGFHFKFDIPSQSSIVLRLRLTSRSLPSPLADLDSIVRQRLKEADEFYDSVHPPRATAEEKMIQRRALAGMLWSKQIYLFDVERWLEGDAGYAPPPPERKNNRNAHWRHLNSMRVLSMPDKWEFPWFAAWDLAFHCVTLALVDPEFAKENLWALLFEQFQHPSGQIPGCEWEFSDMNPPVHAWAVWRVYQREKVRGCGDIAFLEKCLHKLLINFAWWVNRVDREGNNVFEGGFLGLDNITVIDRSEKLPGGATLEQSDATGWMGFFCLYLMRISLELACSNRSYEILATKFFQHFIYIGAAMKKMGGRDYELWDERDGFFYDVLRLPDGSFHKFRLRSMVGLIPLYAVELLEAEDLDPHPEFLANLHWFLKNRIELVGNTCQALGGNRFLLSIADRQQTRRLLQRVGDRDEFLSPYGLRSLSKFHESHPFFFGGQGVGYEPGESNSSVKGGNSNWRGPIWFPTSFLLIRTLMKLSRGLGTGFTVDVPGFAEPVTPHGLARTITERLISIFKLNAENRRPCFGGQRIFQTDPNWRDCLLFNEFYHAETGQGLGASHQTGWTGLIANLIDEWRR
jgi:Mannosylglycerate hydrolase MGH1-like glycoside hydrolase domain